jgi:plasmid maintenance system antidote protein VapI
MEAQFWLNLQTNYDLGVASSGIWDKVKKLIPPFSRAAAM